MSEPAGHSPLGASGAHTWLKCQHSVDPELQGLAKGEDEEDDTFSKPGTAAHWFAEQCLFHGLDGWQMIGNIGPGEVKCDKEMADAVQVYLDWVKGSFPDRNQGNTWTERRFHCPKLHQYFYGTSDFVHLEFVQEESMEEYGAHVLHVADYKHGVGIVVEVKDNPQCMYYACGVLEDLGLWSTVDEVVLHIVQPRAFHPDGPIREWRIRTEDLEKWLFDTLLPGMDNALAGDVAASGEHCRYCWRRKHACRQLAADMKEFEMMVGKGATLPQWSNEDIGKFYNLEPIFKIVKKAASEIAFNRMTAGQSVPGCKLVKAKVNREWKEGAEAAAKAKFGPRAFETKMLSPAQIEKLPEGEALTARWAFKPEAGMAVAKADDNRQAMNKPVTSGFKPVKKVA